MSKCLWIFSKSHSSRQFLSADGEVNLDKLVCVFFPRSCLEIRTLLYNLSFLLFHILLQAVLKADWTLLIHITYYSKRGNILQLEPFASIKIAHKESLSRGWAARSAAGGPPQSPARCCVAELGCRQKVTESLLSELAKFANELSAEIRRAKTLSSLKHFLPAHLYSKKEKKWIIENSGIMVFLLH